MARRHADSYDWHSDTHHLECPRCGHHSVVAHGEGRYACLRCRWHRDVASSSGPLPIPVLIAIAIITIILITGIG
ncbi:MAG: hypothetical protein AAFO06_02625 [Cyanobacteria bacterium J06597_16]